MDEGRPRGPRLPALSRRLTSPSPPAPALPRLSLPPSAPAVSVPAGPGGQPVGPGPEALAGAAGELEDRLAGVVAGAGGDDRRQVELQIGQQVRLVMTRTPAAMKSRGYLAGLSSPSGRESTAAFRSSPRSNSTGQTRLPTFSITTRSRAARSRAARAWPTVAASRWQVPKVSICTAWAPARATRSASRRVCTSPSITPILSRPAKSRMVRSRREVLPAPGLDMRLMALTPAASRRARLRAASSRFWAKRSRSTLISLMIPPPRRGTPPPAPGRSRDRGPGGRRPGRRAGGPGG